MSKLQKILFLLTVFFNVQVFGLNLILPIAGQYKFSEQIKVEKAWKTEMVYLNSNEGKKRLIELKNQNWLCQFLGQNTYKCDLKLSDQNLPADLLQKLNTKYMDYNFTFLEVENYDLINESENLVEFDVRQSTQFNNSKISNYTAQILNKNLIKLKFNFINQDAIYVNILSPNQFAIYEKVNKKKNNQYLNYFVSILFQN